MKVVRAALGDETYLRSGGSAGIRIRVAGGDAEFLNRIERCAQRSLKRVAGQLIIVIQAVQALRWSGRCGRRRRNRRGCRRLIDVLSDIRDAGLEAQNRNWIAAFRG